MNVLIVSANSLAASPTGPAYIAGAALRVGHTVEIFECLFAQDVSSELRACIKRFQPDLVGVSIRLVHGYIIDETPPYYTHHLDLRKNIRQVVDAIRETTNAPIVLGGPGFNYYASDWLEYLGVDYGICGEADRSFPLFLEQLERGGSLNNVPGCVFRQGGQIHKVPRDLVENLNETAFPAYQLLDMKRYQERGISPGILTKRGCAFRCTYCPYRSLEGARYRMKSPARVVDEIEHIQQVCHQQQIEPSKMVMFCENNFNVPRQHAVDICHEILARKVNVRWGTGDLRPLKITPDFCLLMQEAGCDYLNLSIESASDSMLKGMGRGYTAADVEQSLTCLEMSGVPFSASLMFGAPGETPETVQETLAVLDRHTVPLGTWVTLGICLWTPRQEVLAEARRAGQYSEQQNLFDATNYLSPDLSRPYMENLIAALRSKKGYAVQVNQPYAGYRWEDSGEPVLSN